MNMPLPAFTDHRAGFDVASRRRRFYPDRLRRDPVAAFVHRLERTVSATDRVLISAPAAGDRPTPAAKSSTGRRGSDPPVTSNPPCRPVCADIRQFQDATFDVVFRFVLEMSIGRRSSSIARVLSSAASACR
jgi:hypothetical protein